MKISNYDRRLYLNYIFIFIFLTVITFGAYFLNSEITNNKLTGFIIFNESNTSGFNNETEPDMNITNITIDNTTTDNQSVINITNETLNYTELNISTDKIANQTNITEINESAINETLSITPDNLTNITETDKSIILNETLNQTELNKTIDIVNQTNITEVNETSSTIPYNLTNITKTNETLNKTEAQNTTTKPVNKTETIIQYQAEIGKPVKWVKKIKLDKAVENISVELPENIENVKIYKFTDGNKFDINIDKIKLNKSGKHIPIAQTNLITGYVVLGYKEDWHTKILDWLNYILNHIFKKIKSITGFAVYQAEQTNSTELVIEEEVEEIEIEYYTEAPQVLEKEISSYKKQITVYSDVHYENILAYTNIKEATKDSIKLYRITQGIREQVQIINYTDTNNNSLIDKISWIVPSLSNETYEVEITILNIQSYPTVGGNWIVMFNTTGTADLKITAMDGTTWSNENEDNDLKFLEVRCGDIVKEYEWINNSVFIANYSCDEIGYEVSKVLTAGKHNLMFEFGDNVEYAYNQAGWWNSSWQYRKEINVSNTYADLTEYQILLYVDTSGLITAGKMNSDCSDIRFTNSTGGIIPYYLDENPGFDCNEDDTLIWIQTDVLTNKTNTTFYMYYGNSGASTLSDMTDVFNYSKLKTIYYTVGENVYDGPIQVVAYRDNTNVTATGKSVILNAGRTANFTTAQYGGTGASYLNVTSPIIGGDNDTTVGAEINPISWASKEFVIGNGRGAFDLYFYSPFENIYIDCYEANTTVGTWGVTRDNATCNKGTACSATIRNWTSGSSIFCNSTAPFLMFVESGANANFPVYPMSNDVWGISDSIIANAKTGVLIQELGSDGTNTTGTRNIAYRIAKTDGIDGSGLAWHIIADQVAIGGNAHADGDGSENAVYSPEFELEKEYYLYKAGDYVAIAATRVNTNCTLYTNGGYANISNMSSGTKDYPFPSNVDIGTGNDIQKFTAGAKVVCNATWGGHWETIGDDESTLFGMKSGRQYVYPEPTYVIGSEETPSDTTPPTISNLNTNATNLTKRYQTVNLSAICDDETGAGQIWYSKYNQSIYYNSTPVNYLDNVIYTFNITIDEKRGTDVNLTIYCNDSSGNEATFAGWIGFTVNNTQPSYSGNPSINNTSPSKQNTINCSLVGATFSDMDSDTENTPAYIWYRNNAEIGGATSSTISLTPYSSNDKFLCGIKAYDNYDYANFYVNSSNVAIIDNRTPSYSNNRTNTTSPYNNDLVQINTTWTDNLELSHTWCGNNFTGTWINETPIARTGLTSVNHTNITQFTAGVGKTACYYCYANDTSSNFNSTQLSCITSTALGSLNTTLLSPTGTNSQPQNQTFLLKANVTCVGQAGATCGVVNATVRYNLSANPDTKIQGDNTYTTPFYTVQPNPQTCGSMSSGEACNLTWAVNTTGNIGDSYKIDVNFTSDIASNKTNFTTINIISPVISITISDALTNIQFNSSLSPGTTNNAALNNSDNAYNITCNYEPGNCNISIKGNDNIVTGPNTIGIGNVSWNKKNDPTDEKNLTTSYNIINATLSHLLSQLIYFWIDIPTSQVAGDYKSNFTIQGQPS